MSSTLRLSSTGVAEAAALATTDNMVSPSRQAIVTVIADRRNRFIELSCPSSGSQAAPLPVSLTAARLTARKDRCGTAPLRTVRVNSFNRYPALLPKHPELSCAGPALTPAFSAPSLLAGDSFTSRGRFVSACPGGRGVFSRIRPTPRLSGGDDHHRQAARVANTRVGWSILRGWAEIPLGALRSASPGEGPGRQCEPNRGSFASIHATSLSLVSKSISKSSFGR